MGAGFGVHTVDILMVLHQRCDGLWCKLEGDFVLRHHVDMYNVRFNIDHLVVEETFDQRIRVFDKLCFWSLGQAQRAQGPYRRLVRKGLGQTSKVLWYTVERPLDTVDSLQCGGQPRRYLGGKDNVWLGASLERTSRGGQELLRHDGDGSGRMVDRDDSGGRVESCVRKLKDKRNKVKELSRRSPNKGNSVHAFSVK